MEIEYPSYMLSTYKIESELITEPHLCIFSETLDENNPLIAYTMSTFDMLRYFIEDNYTFIGTFSNKNRRITNANIKIVYNLYRPEDPLFEFGYETIDLHSKDYNIYLCKLNDGKSIYYKVEKLKSDKEELCIDLVLKVIRQKIKQLKIDKLIK